MKYLIILLSLIFLSSCSYSPKIEDYNYLENNSLRFIKTKDDTSILINKDDIYYLLLLGSQNIDIEVDYLLKYQDVKTNLKSKETYTLNVPITINDITFKAYDKIEIIINNNTFCIYIKALDQDNYQSCDFIYLYHPDNKFYITLNNHLKALFYDSYTKFNYQFMHHLAFVWIDTYTVSSSNYTTVTIEEDNYKIIETKIRGKTIHKKTKT